MKTVQLNLKENPYKIIIGLDVLKSAGPMIRNLKIGTDAIVITHPVIKKLYGAPLTRSLVNAGISVKFFEVPSGEKSKSAAVAIKLLEQIARYDVLKKSFIVALGGGVIGDLGGFVASVYKRGIPYVQVPTTLLAQIDSAIGGKVAIDLSVGKNLTGAFHQPKIVLSDVAVLKSLDQRQIRNGLAEAVKYGVIYDKNLFQFLVKHYQDILQYKADALSHLVAECSRIKVAVVKADEKETKGIRTILNFGHTVGHAIEAAGKFKLYHHGESVALGMRVASEISVQMGIFNSVEAEQLNQLLTKIGLPKEINQLKVSNIVQLMQHDKKFVAGKNRFVLVQQIGKVKVVEGVPADLIRKAIAKFLTR
jgi:3-dehydroquinate synthase